MATKLQQRAQKKYAGFIGLVEGVAAELYTKDQWEDAIDNGSPLNLEHYEMLQEVYETAYERDPSAFKGIQWINSDYGMPAWVRPGVEWEPA
jgi:hypothetical protein